MTAAVAPSNSVQPSSKRSGVAGISLGGPHPSPGMTAAGPVKKRKVSDDLMMYDRSVESSPSGTARTATARRPAKVTKKTNAQAATGGSANANPQKKKKPQNKYEPDVPMTKEAAAAWRREQRRKRNRESAANSRQRQRDRTVELEAELGEWKAKFSAVMDRLNAAEAARGIVPSTPSDLPISEEIRVESGTGSTDTTNGTTVPTDPTAAAPHQGSPSTSNETQQQKHHLIETISRPA